MILIRDGRNWKPIKARMKTLFKPGDVVKLKQSKYLDQSPVMFVVGPDNKRFVTEGKDTLKGIKCRWFTSNLQVQECTFSTKDLELVKSFNGKTNKTN